MNTAIQKGTTMLAIAGHADPVPEPSTRIQMLGGFAGLGLVTRAAIRPPFFA
jgi:hypothetical protein